MSSHEKHQYYYEKYLRNEMSDMERHTFEEKMSEDESFRRSFNHYKSNRKEFLAELLEEDDLEAKRRWGLNSWLYLIISVTGIALAMYYYSSKNDAIQASNIKTDNSWQIFKRIPFLREKTEFNKQEPSKNIKTPSDTKLPITELVDTAELNGYIEPAIGYDKEETAEDVGIESDIMTLDSFITAYEKSYFELRLKAIKEETDSIIVDSMMHRLAIKSASRNAQQSKPITVYVEFWRSPVNFKGYKFNGKKLVIYGIASPNEVYLLHNEDEFILHSHKYEFTLTPDNNFHKF